MRLEDFLKELGVSGSEAAKARSVLNTSPYKKNIKNSMRGTFIEGDIEEMLAYVKKKMSDEFEAKQRAKEEEDALRRRIQEEEDALSAKLAKILVTSGYNFEGYKITRYSGYISGDDAVSVDRGFAGYGQQGTDVGEYLLKSLTIIRQNALRELKEAADALGCNAVIGVDFDYITLDPETANMNGGTTYYPYVFCVTANGTAVEIEKE